MSRKAATYCRDARGIGLAWGVRFLKQRHRRERQLEDIRKEMAKPEFPARHKQGWLREEIVNWKLGGGRNAAPPARGNGEVDSADLFADKRKADALRKQNIWRKYSSGQKVGAADLRFAGIQDVVGPDSENLSGQEGVAEYIRTAYRHPCHKVDVNRWLHGRNLPSGCTEHFPASFLSGRWKKAAVDIWVQRYLVARPDAQGAELGMAMPADWRGREEQLRFERSNAEFELWKQEHSGQYVPRADAERTGTAIGIAARNITRDMLEKDLVKKLVEAFNRQDARDARTTEILRAACTQCFEEWQGRFGARLAELLETKAGDLEKGRAGK